MKQILIPVMICLVSWQTTFAQDAAQATAPTQLNLVVVSGEGTLTKTGERVTDAPTVRVEDQNQKPLSGVAVVFTLPAGGAGGEFDRGSKTSTVITDDKGLAAARGLKLNDTPGRYEILVNVAYRGLTAGTTVTQFATAPNGAVTHTQHKSGSSKWLWIGLIGGGAAAGAAVAASHGGGSSSSGSGTTPPSGGGGAATISISVGTSTVTHP
jgi:hypothetical protein